MGKKNLKVSGRKKDKKTKKKQKEKPDKTYEKNQGKKVLFVNTVNLAYNEILGSDSISSLDPRSRWIKGNF